MPQGGSPPHHILATGRGKAGRPSPHLLRVRFACCLSLTLIDLVTRETEKFSYLSCMAMNLLKIRSSVLLYKKGTISYLPWLRNKQKSALILVFEFLFGPFKKTNVWPIKMLCGQLFTINSEMCHDYLYKILHRNPEIIWFENGLKKTFFHSYL